MATNVRTIIGKKTEVNKEASKRLEQNCVLGILRVMCVNFRRL